MRRLAFFGGSFDPPHRGHLAVARAAADRFELDQVLFAPAALQPFKLTVASTSFSHRYAMTALATQADARFVPSLLDAPAAGDAPGRPNYTIESLERLRRLHPEDVRIFVLVGADSWAGISGWHRAQELLAGHDWIVAARPGFSLANATGALPAGITAEHVSGERDCLLLRHATGARTRIFLLPDLAEDVAATELRRRLARSAAACDLLAPSVGEYIRKVGLYDAHA